MALQLPNPDVFQLETYARNALVYCAISNICSQTKYICQKICTPFHVVLIYIYNLYLFIFICNQNTEIHTYIYIYIYVYIYIRIYSARDFPLPWPPGQLLAKATGSPAPWRVRTIWTGDASRWMPCSCRSRRP